ncbi:MAG: terminase TerL endonuclease subunit [Bacilli bacterium]|uniref:terminase large subunit n=1 Tax=Chryseobacterium sp. TaxID=1871047 RepID=UPI002FC949EF
MSYIEQYFGAILNNKIVACDKIKRQANILIEQLINPREFHFDADIANKHIDFIELFCKTPAGNIGEPLKLELFQKARLQAVFGFVDDNNLRQYNEVLVVEGRKNGKTTECAAVEIDLAMNDGEGAPEIYNIATKYEQAMKGWTAANNMRLQSKEIKKHLKKRSSDMYCKYNMGIIKAMASNVKSLDSLDAHGVIIDELAAITNRDIYDLMKQSMGARAQPLLFCITTNGFVRNGIFDAQYNYADRILKGEVTNKRFLPLIYELDNIDEMWNEKMWIKANPGLGTIKKLEFQREMVQKAKDDTTFLPTVVVKDFNIPQTKESAWMRYEELNNEAEFDIVFDYAIGGFDAADSIDLNAAKALCMRPNDPNIYIKSMYWIPEAVIEKQNKLGDRKGRDSVPYDLWIQQGYMRTCPGAKCDKKIFVEWFKELRDEEDLFFYKIGYDPWHVDDSTIRELKREFGENSIVPVRQGVKSLSKPMKDLKGEFLNKNIVYNNNPIDKWCLINTTVKSDINGNIQPVKSADQTQRIDGTIALVNAYKILQDNENYIDLNEPEEPVDEPKEGD